jgi:hypothetical protein
MINRFQHRLTVESGDGSHVDEYRVRDRQVEFRACLRDGTPPSGEAGWRQLTADDISLHLALNTVVAEWLMWNLDLLGLGFSLLPSLIFSTPFS